MFLAGKALHEVRLQLQREGTQLKRGDVDPIGQRLESQSRASRTPQDLRHPYARLGRAMSLRETFQAIFANSERQLAEPELRWWRGWAVRSRLSFGRLAMTLRQLWEGASNDVRQ